MIVKNNTTALFQYDMIFFDCLVTATKFIILGVNQWRTYTNGLLYFKINLHVSPFLISFLLHALYVLYLKMHLFI